MRTTRSYEMAQRSPSGTCGDGHASHHHPHTHSRSGDVATAYSRTACTALRGQAGGSSNERDIPFHQELVGSHTSLSLVEERRRRVSAAPLAAPVKRHRGTGGLCVRSTTPRTAMVLCTETLCDRGCLGAAGGRAGVMRRSDRAARRLSSLSHMRSGVLDPPPIVCPVRRPVCRFLSGGSGSDQVRDSLVFDQNRRA
jgi:hypothetical protein